MWCAKSERPPAYELRVYKRKQELGLGWNREEESKKRQLPMSHCWYSRAKGMEALRRRTIYSVSLLVRTPRLSQTGSWQGACSDYGHVLDEDGLGCRTLSGLVLRSFGSVT
jgi:hypothetical protein